MFDYQNLYKYSIDFQRNYGEYYYNLLCKDFPDEIAEREKINEIILDKSRRIGNKLEKILIIQMFSNCFTIFHLSYDELLSFLITQTDNNLPPTVTENGRLEKLTKLIQLIKADLITVTGIHEFYPEWKYLDKYILGNILKSADYNHLSQMIQSSDVKLALLTYKKTSITKFKNKVIKGNLSYIEFKKERKNFEAMYPDGKYKEKLNDLEDKTKFKITPYCISLIKKLRHQTIYGIDMFNVDLLLDLQQNIAPIYWRRINKTFWKGIIEYKSIIRLKEINFEKYDKRRKVYLGRYIYYYDRLSNLFDNNSKKCVIIEIDKTLNK